MGWSRSRAAGAAPGLGAPPPWAGAGAGAELLPPPCPERRGPETSGGTSGTVPPSTTLVSCGGRPRLKARDGQHVSICDVHAVAPPPRPRRSGRGRALLRRCLARSRSSEPRDSLPSRGSDAKFSHGTDPPGESFSSRCPRLSHLRSLAGRPDCAAAVNGAEQAPRPPPACPRWPRRREVDAPPPPPRAARQARASPRAAGGTKVAPRFGPPPKAMRPAPPGEARGPRRGATPPTPLAPRTSYLVPRTSYLVPWTLDLGPWTLDLPWTRFQNQAAGGRGRAGLGAGGAAWAAGGGRHGPRGAAGGPWVRRGSCSSPRRGRWVR